MLLVLLPALGLVRGLGRAAGLRRVRTEVEAERFVRSPRVSRRRRSSILSPPAPATVAISCGPLSPFFFLANKPSLWVLLLAHACHFAKKFLMGFLSGAHSFCSVVPKICSSVYGFVPLLIWARVQVRWPFSDSVGLFNSWYNVSDGMGL
jgi:hypothetical protein